MGKSVLELAVSTGRWEAGLKKAQQALNNFTDDQGGFQAALQKDSKNMQGFIQMMGSIDSHAKTSRGQLNDYKNSFEQLTIAYNQMSDAEKRNPVGQAMSKTLDQLRTKIEATRQQMDELNKSMNGATPSTGAGLFGGGKLDGMLQVFGGNLMTKGTGMLAGLASEMGDMVKQGVELAKQGEGIRIAFERLGRGDILDGLREATHNTVSDIELMKAAVKFNDFKLPVEELGTMLAFAQQKAKDTGQSIDYMVDSIVTGLGRKSLMILDNLGLSAAEIKDKMKETGDMTKAVGEIIREQMQKAGDYVETAADRAAQQNVMLQNKMEELGRKFLPVKQASDDLWTSMKIGILDIVGGPLADLLNGLTRAGQLRNELKNIGSDERVNSDISKLKGSNFKEKVYTAMLNKYSREEQRALDNYKKAQKGGMGSVAIWENRYLAQKAMREDFQARGKAVVNGTTVSPSNPLPVEIKNPKGGTTDTIDIEKIKFGGWDGVKADPNATFQSVQAMLGDEGLRKMLGIAPQQTFDLGRDISKGWQLDSKGQLVQKKDKDAQNADKTIVSEMGKLTSGVSGIFSGIEQMGIEVPDEIKNVINGLNGIMTILTSINTILGVIEGLQAVGVLPFFAHGGIVPHAATGLVVPGNDHADKTPVLVSSGELILNSAQQNALANELQGGGLRNLRLRTEVSGRNLIVVIENDLAARGKGQLATFKS